MKDTRLMMGMPITVVIVSHDKITQNSVQKTIDEVFDYFKYVDQTFSVYKEDSEICKINSGLLQIRDACADVREIFELAEQTKKQTDGYFDIKNRKGLLDPSGIVKGWAIFNASKIIEKNDFRNYYVNAGGDIQVGGNNEQGQKWKVGIENPFKQGEIVKTVYLSDCGIATSGTYIRGQHIYNPKNKDEILNDVASLTIIGPNVYEADRFSTPCFAMGLPGISFVEEQKNLEGYIIDNKGVATMTSGFEQYTNAKD